MFINFDITKEADRVLLEELYEDAYDESGLFLNL